jgi:hypothetical protein
MMVDERLARESPVLRKGAQPRPVVIWIQGESQHEEKRESDEDTNRPRLLSASIRLHGT